MTELADRPIATARNPYVGPRSLVAGEPIYGRDRELDELRDALIADRLVLLYSPSGAGKSSLLEAGLRPALEAKEFLVSPTIRVSQHVEGAANRYAASTMLSLEPMLPPDQRPPVSAFDSTTLADYVARIDVDGESEICLIFDQFEEVFTLDPVDLSVKAAFFDELGLLLRDRSIWAVIALREDYLAQLDPFLAVFPRRLATRMRLDFLDQRAASAAVRSPARAVGVEFTDDAAELLVDDLRTVNVVRGGKPSPEKGPYVEPVQLQVVCSKLWSQLPEGADTVTRADVETHADTDNALAGFYADQVAAVATATGVSERVIRDWFEHSLITDQSFRAQSFEFPHERGAEVLKALEDAYLIRADSRRGVNWYELTHDRMIAPVIENNAEWRGSRLNPLQMRASEWEAHGRPAGLLVTGDVLTDAETWAATSADATPTERDFVAASRSAENDARAELARHEAEARKARRRSLLFGALALVAVAGLIVATISFVSANDSRRRAQGARRDADASAAAAKAAQTKAESAQRESEARDLAARSLANGDPYEAALLAIEAESWTDEPGLQPRLAWADAAARIGRLPAVQDGPAFDVGGEPSAIALSPDGRHLAIGDYDGVVTIYDRTDRSVVGEPIELQSAADQTDITPTPQQLGWSRDGATIWVLTDDGVVRRFDARTHAPVGAPSATRDSAQLLAVDPSGRFLAIAGDDNAITIYDTTSDAAVGRPTVVPGGAAPLTMSWSPNGSELAVGDEGGGVTLVDRRNGVARPLQRAGPALPDVDQSVSSLAWSPDGTAVAAATGSEAVEIIPLPGSAVPSTATLVGDTVATMAWSPNGRVIAIVTDNGAVNLLQSTAGGSLGDAFAAADSTASSVAWSPNGEELAIGSAEGTAALFKIRADPKGADEIDTGDGVSGNVAWSPTAPIIAVGFADGTVRRFDASNGSPVGAKIASRADGLERATQLIPTTVWSPDGAQLATSRGDGTWQIVDAATGARRAVIGKATPPPTDQSFEDVTNDSRLAWSPDGRSIALGESNYGSDLGEDGDGSDATPSITLFDASTYRPVGDPITTDELDPTYLAWSPDSSELAAGGSAGTVVVLDARTGEQTGDTIDVTDAGLTGLAWNPTGQTIVASGDRKLYLFDAASHDPVGDPVLVEPSSQNATAAIAWSPSGNVIATLGDHGMVRLFDSTSLASVGPGIATPASGQASTPATLSWSGDGSSLAILGDEPGVRLLHSWSESAACDLIKSVVPATRMDDLIDIPKATSKCAHGTVAATPPVPVLTEPLG